MYLRECQRELWFKVVVGAYTNFFGSKGGTKIKVVKNRQSATKWLLDGSSQQITLFYTDSNNNRAEQFYDLSLVGAKMILKTDFFKKVAMPQEKIGLLFIILEKTLINHAWIL